MDDSDHRGKQGRFTQEVIRARPIIYRTVYKWMQNKWDTDDIVGETECRCWAYMEEREWEPKIRNMVAFEMKIAINVRNDLWTQRKNEGSQSLDDDSSKRIERYLTENESAGGASEIEKQIYNRELFDELAWKFIFAGFTPSELEIFEMHAVDKMTPKEIAYELRKDVHLLRYELQNIEAKIRSRGKQHLDRIGRKFVYKREV